MFSICTAGHINHGKTSLIKKLTGENTDRLIQEKNRGMSIELGFAKYTSSKNINASIIDVPGHEKFIKNMISGTYAVDLVLLVIAANDGIKKQTLEHLKIIKSLEIENLIVVVNKIDLIEKAEFLKLKDNINNLLEKNKFYKTKIVEISIKNNIGLDLLKRVIDSEIHKERITLNGPSRISIDRVFTLKGKGTIITGTLLGRSISSKSKLEIFPNNKLLKIKKIESFNENTDHITSGSRCAINIQNLDSKEISKGSIISEKGFIITSKFIYVKTNLIKIIKNNSEVMFHTGTSRSNGRLQFISEKKIAKIYFKNSISFIVGDTFIIRNNAGTVGGGKIIFPEKLKEEALVKNFAGSDLSRIITLLKIKKTVEVKDVSNYLGILEKEIINISNSESKIIISEKKGILIEKEFLIDNLEKFYKDLLLFHKNNPLKLGVSVSFINEKKENYLIINLLLNKKLIELNETHIYKTGFKPTPSINESLIIDRFIDYLNINPFSNPDKKLPNEELLNFLLNKNLIIKSSNNVFFSKKSFEKIKKEVFQLNKKYGKININIIRDNLNISRKYCLAILDKMEDQNLISRDRN
jgi:selenocysteine-specific elongation factor